MTQWGLCATIKAPLDDILHFAAYHLEAGAHRIYICLDDDHRDAYDVLKTHPKLRVTICDEAYWNGKRPPKHQQRQSRNATRAYAKADDLDWLIHMDVDEFIVSDQKVEQILSAIPPQTNVTRIRPMEALSGNNIAVKNTSFKAFIPAGPERDRILHDLYPTFGIYLKGGFLSHLAGKVFVRTGLENIQLRIHNAFQNGEALKGIEHQQGIDLAHCHAKNWDAWRAAFPYRFEHGSYRADLGPNRARNKGGLSTHELLQMIMDESGEAGLRAFFDEVAVDSAALRSKLNRHGLLKRANLGLKATLSTHFPCLAR